MEKQFQVAKPTDFEVVIKYILDWYKESELDTLVLALKGDLGAGKTTFTQEIGRFFAVSESITSPTFGIMKQYAIDSAEFDQLVHIDAYRIEEESEVVPLRINEVLKRPKTLVCIEWPEQIPSVIPTTAVKINMVIGEDELRTVTVKLPVEK